MAPLGVPPRRLATGGGSRGDAWTGMVADVLDVEIGQPAHVPGAAHGAAVLAWRARGREVPAPAVTRWRAPRPDEAYRDAYARYREHAPPLDVADA
jgi:sugar (pentulose or hexulose) kinase